MVKRRPTPELDKLMKRVRALLKARGSQQRLAEFLGVVHPTLSDWIRGRYEPGGEVTLQLLSWVTAEEAKQKETPTEFVPQPGQMTRSAKSKANEKVQSDQGRPSHGAPDKSSPRPARGRKRK